MSVNWTITAFDWSRLQELEGPLAAAHESGDFTRLSLPEIDSIFDHCPEDEPAESLCNAIIQVLCCGEESAEFPSGFAELIHWLRKQPKGELPAEVLAQLITSEPNVEDWFRTDFGVVGILDVWQTLELLDQLKAFLADYVPPKLPRGFASLARRFSPSESHQSQIPDLLEIATHAAQKQVGLAALRS